MTRHRINYMLGLISESAKRDQRMAFTKNLSETGRQFQYVPTLRTKAGEIVALAHLSPQARLRTVPVFQMVTSLAPSFAPSLASAWTGMPMALDGLEHSTSNGLTNDFLSLFGTLGHAGVPVTPVMDVDGTAIYNAAAFGMSNKYAPGLVLRAPLASLNIVAGWFQGNGGNPAVTDLLIDCGHIADISPGLILPVVQTALHGQNLSIWRSVALTSSSAPKDASSLKYGPNTVPRRDWALWFGLASHYPAIHFGDFGISHRDSSEPPGYAMANATVSVRYCLDNDWLIRKGRSTRGANGIPMANQYHAHAQSLAGHTHFGSVANCWADNEIAKIAAMAGVGKSNNRTGWVSIALNRHLELVCDRLP
jgi:hypothetical protein